MKDVEIKVSLASQNDGVLKPRRGKSQVIRVKATSNKSEIIGKAVAKHSRFDQSFDDSVAYTLLYPDFSEAVFIPGTSDMFTLSAYKEAIGKDYQRLTFYIIPFDEFYDEQDNGNLNETSADQPVIPHTYGHVSSKDDDDLWEDWTLSTSGK